MCVTRRRRCGRYRDPMGRIVTPGRPSCKKLRADRARERGYRVAADGPGAVPTPPRVPATGFGQTKQTPIPANRTPVVALSFTELLDKVLAAGGP